VHHAGDRVFGIEPIRIDQGEQCFGADHDGQVAVELFRAGPALATSPSGGSACSSKPKRNPGRASAGAALPMVDAIIERATPRRARTCRNRNSGRGADPRRICIPKWITSLLTP
jgi:hypothetical protein